MDGWDPGTGGIGGETGGDILGLWEGATENAGACTALLGNLRECGIRTDRSVLVVIDGSKALAKAVRDVFGARALIQRCQVHKKRNVLDQLPEKLQPPVKAAMTEATAAAMSTARDGGSSRSRRGLRRTTPAPRKACSRDLRRRSR